MKRQNKIIFLMIMLAVALSVFFFLIGGSLANIKFSEVNTGTFVVPPPNNTSIQKAINTSVNQTSPSNSIQNLLDQAGCKDNSGICAASSPKLLINTQIVLYDSNQQQYPYSTYVNIPLQDILGLNKFNAYDTYGNLIDKVSKLSLTDSQGHLLDLGTVKLSMYAVTNYDTNVIVSGDFAVYLDNQLRGSKHLAIQGMTQNKSIAMQINGQPAYGFTFKDEGANWVDGSQHIFKVVIGNVTATIGTGQNTQIFQYTKSAIAYVLVMTVNQQKITTIGVDNKAITVYKSDDTITACSRNAVLGSQALGSPGSSYYGQYSVFVSKYATSTGLITISQNGFPIMSISSSGSTPNFNTGNIDSVDTSIVQGGKSCSTKTGLPRDTDLTFNINGKTVLYHTPITQINLIYDCSGDAVANDPSSKNTGFCPSNFIK